MGTSQFQRHVEIVTARVQQAARSLGVGSDATPNQIRAAFARKVKEYHPDAGGSGGDIQQLKQARNLLLESAKTQRLPSDKAATMQTCQMCSGSGRVSTMGFGSERCTTCSGTGEVGC